MAEDKELEKQRADENNAKVARAALDVADAAAVDPATKGAVKGAKAADKLTGGAISNLAGKALSAVNKINPAGKKTQDAINGLGESGLADKTSRAASLVGKGPGTGRPNETPNQVKNPKTEGGEQESSLPSSSDKKNQNVQNNQSTGGGSSSKDNNKKSESKEKEASDESSSNDATFGGKSRIKVSMPVKIIVSVLMPVFILFFVIIVVVTSFVGEFFDFDDAVGISYAAGEETGNMNFKANSKEQTDFYNRVIEVKNSNASRGRSVDTLKVVAVFHVLQRNGANMTYENMTTEKIQDIVECMYNGNTTSDEILKTNLIRYLIPKYLPDTQDSKRVYIADEVFKYIDDYYSLIGKEKSTCANAGSCDYSIKGFKIEGKGQVNKSVQVSDLYVRLMQCGTVKVNGEMRNYGGTAGQPLADEELVPFEKYILGVAYAEVGSNVPAESIKTQMVAARSFALARPDDMGGWRTLKNENGKWILQAAACTLDQVYCDPDQGCSYNNAQWGQVRSGKGKGSHYRPPLAENSPMRTYAKETQGEVLLDSQGYIIATYYKDADQKKWAILANNGLNYKQILLQHYNQGKYNYGASSVGGSSCNGGGKCAPTGSYAGWKQYEGPWVDTTLGNSGRTIRQIGCLVTSLSIQIAKSGVSTNISGEFNPGSFVEYLSAHGGFDAGGSIATWTGITNAAPGFVYQGEEYFNGMSREQKLNRIKEIVNTPGMYAVAEVKGNTGQHWVAIDSVNGDNISMMDPGSSSTSMWTQYNWANTSKIVYFKVG